MATRSFAELNSFERNVVGVHRQCKFSSLMFIPHDGICPRCHRNIFDDEYTFNRADKERITGCPFCHISYCE